MPVVLCIALIFAFACRTPVSDPGQKAYTVPEDAFDPARVADAPDYSLPSSWLALPAPDMEKPVDVFYVHPTTYFSNEHWNQPGPMDDVDGRSGEKVVAQAGAFCKCGNIFAPWYRQATLEVLNARPDDKAQALDVAYQDVKAAFSHYMENYNEGRPFILAGHSQGSNHLLRLLTEEFGNRHSMDRLVAAYVVGWPVTRGDLLESGHLVMCDSPDQTGCIVSWNTQSPFPDCSLTDDSTLGVNPLTWTRTDEFVPRRQNRGAVFFRDGRRVVIPHYVGARLHDGALLVEPSEDGIDLDVPCEGFYHKYDYAFFFNNIRENSNVRSSAWFERQ